MNKKTEGFIGLIIILSVIIIFKFYYWSTDAETGDILEESEITIEIPDSCSYHTYYISSYCDFKTKQNYLYRLNLNNKYIEVYDLDKMKFDKIISLNYKIGGFHIEDHNNIFVLEYDKNIINHIDSTGKIIKSLDLNKQITDSIQRIIYSFTNRPLINYNSHLIFNLVTKVSPPNFYNYETIGIYSGMSDNGNLTKTAVFPKSMRDGKDRFGYYPSYNIVDNMILCSFAADHNLFFYQIDGDFIYKENCKSEYIEEFPITDLTQFTNREYNAKFQLETPAYYTLLYDKYSQLIYRVCLHEQKMVDDSTGMVNGYFDREWSLIVLNKDLDILNEIKFPAKEYLCQEICVTKDGLLISLNNENNPDFDPNKLSYKLLKFTDE